MSQFSSVQSLITCTLAHMALSYSRNISLTTTTGPWGHGWGLKNWPHIAKFNFRFLLIIISYNIGRTMDIYISINYQSMNFNIIFFNNFIIILFITQMKFMHNIIRNFIIIFDDLTIFNFVIYNFVKRFLMIYSQCVHRLIQTNIGRHADLPVPKCPTTFAY